MVKYEYFDDGKLLITKYSGDIDKESIKLYIQHVFTKTECDNLEKLILDYRNAQMLFNPDALLEIALARKLAEAGRIKNKSVFIVDSPIETAFISIISQKYNKDLNPADFCSSVSRCIKSLSLDITADELDKRLKELKNEFVA